MKLTNRGWFVAGFVSALALMLAFYVMNHIWWTPTGYCWGSVNDCLNALNLQPSVVPGK
jgi:hypothetical protein